MDAIYVVKRSMLWFYIGQEVSYTELCKWYTVEAVAELIDNGYLKNIN